MYSKKITHIFLNHGDITIVDFIIEINKDMHFKLTVPFITFTS